MGKVIHVVFGKDGGRKDRSNADDLNRAFEFCKRAAEIEDDESKREITKHLLEHALVLDPHNVDALVRLGTQFYLEKNTVKAIELWLRAWHIDDTQPTIPYNIGTAYLVNQDCDEAVFWLHRALKLDPEMFLAVFNIAVAYERAELPKTARKFWYRAMELNPNDPSNEFIKKHVTKSI